MYTLVKVEGRKIFIHDDRDNTTKPISGAQLRNLVFDMDIPVRGISVIKQIKGYYCVELDWEGRDKPVYLTSNGSLIKSFSEKDISWGTMDNQLKVNSIMVEDDCLCFVMCTKGIDSLFYLYQHDMKVKSIIKDFTDEELLFKVYKNGKELTKKQYQSLIDDWAVVSFDYAKLVKYSSDIFVYYFDEIRYKDRIFDAEDYKNLYDWLKEGGIRIGMEATERGILFAKLSKVNRG